MAEPQKFIEFFPGQHLVRPIPFKAHRVEGFSPETLEHHYEEIYGGAVRRLNAVERQLAALKHPASQNALFAELKSEEYVLANAIVLHEAHFASLGDDGGVALLDVELRQAIEVGLGGIDTWRDEILELTRSWRHEPGWITVSWSPRLCRLMTAFTKPDRGAIGTFPVLALDLNDYTHGADFESDVLNYVNTFLDNIHWGRVADRFRQATGSGFSMADSQECNDRITVQALKSLLDSADESLLVLDVRHDDDRERYTSRIMETDWRDSFKVDEWADECPRDKTVVVYCMYGFWVSRKVTQELRAKGLDAKSLEGGISAWRAMGLPSTAIPSE